MFQEEKRLQWQSEISGRKKTATAVTRARVFQKEKRLANTLKLYLRLTWSKICIFFFFFGGGGVCTYIYIYVYMHIYIYIERETIIISAMYIT